jgi:1,2-phenylacetyl-CoA epoxidase PaaB subunit
MKKGYVYIESDFYIRMSNLVNQRAKIERDGKIYDGIIKKEKNRFYLLVDNKEIKIKPSDNIKVEKLEKKLK